MAILGTSPGEKSSALNTAEIKTEGKKEQRNSSRPCSPRVISLRSFVPSSDRSSDWDHLSHHISWYIFFLSYFPEGSRPLRKGVLPDLLQTPLTSLCDYSHVPFLLLKQFSLFLLLVLQQMHSRKLVSTKLIPFKNLHFWMNSSFFFFFSPALFLEISMRNNKMNATINVASLSTFCSFKYRPLDMPSILQGLFLESLLPSRGPTKGSDHLGRNMLQKPFRRGRDAVLLQQWIWPLGTHIPTPLLLQAACMYEHCHRARDCSAQGGNYKLILHLLDWNSLCHCVQQTPAAATRALPAASRDTAQAETHAKGETSLLTQSTQVRRDEYAWGGLSWCTQAIFRTENTCCSA